VISGVTQNRSKYFYPSGKPEALILGVIKGLQYGLYSFALDALRLNASGFCNVGGNSKATIMKHSQAGFTIIEMAIVMVIIGMLVGFGASLIGPLSIRAKRIESTEIVEAGVEAIIGQAMQPTMASFLQFPSFPALSENAMTPGPAPFNTYMTQPWPMEIRPPATCAPEERRISP
jgi:prepilin-type N-terminal cleavage/methylation domain-containing protein